MDEAENVFPLDISERAPGARPWKFRPDGYLVVILAGDDEARQAEGALVGVGFASRDIKRYAGKQILATYEVYKGQRDLADKVVGVVADDLEGRDLYLDYAKKDRCALWLRVDELKVARALRALADYDYLHTRYYGVKSETDYHVSEQRIPSDLDGNADDEEFRRGYPAEPDR
jgi:hypothetical protein